MPDKLTPQQKGFMALIMRSPDQGGGWRRVSKMVWPLVARAALPDELIEVRPEGDAGMVRLTERGEAVALYT